MVRKSVIVWNEHATVPPVAPATDVPVRLSVIQARPTEKEPAPLSLNSLNNELPSVKQPTQPDRPSVLTQGMCFILPKFKFLILLSNSAYITVKNT